eukprot:gb/GEZN01001068.1/.p1 GENE.gb/GEZN01001068.1/~~gb/GEZN01001068.1/.p1  ORF type:complete len:1020 (-),score=206.38 gb/GEZN01001068.1/:214-3273(-)
MSEEKEAVVDESLYSRQLYVYGHEAQQKLQATNVLIVGLKGLGLEIAKNIILAGVKSVGLLDNGLAQVQDLSAQFYLSEKDVGKPRAVASLPHLNQLNRYVNVHLVKEDLSTKVLASKKYQVVVMTDKTVEEQLQVNSYCHEHGLKFISGDIRGLFAAVFVDLGIAHKVTDKNGERPMRGLVVNITQGSPGVVTVHEDQRHGLEDGDLVTFEEVEGMTELNGSQPRKVKVLNPFSFSIEDTSNYKAYTGTRGYYQQVQDTLEISFKPLKEANNAPEFVGDVKWNAIQLHLLYGALSKWQAAHGGRLPDPTKIEEAVRVVALAEQEAKAAKLELDKKLLTRLARCSSAQLCPMAALAGGVIGQEVLKACTGKFMPIRQFFYWDASSALPETDLPPTEYAPMKSRYDGQIATFGRTLHHKVTQLRYFLVGAGAIGCEMLKNWAMMGIATEGKGMVEVTDMDTIEKSNLSRQFLFRETDIGQVKSICAAKAVKQMNSKMTINAQSVRVGPATEDVYDEKFWTQLDGVVTALDNVDARLYIDSRCVYFQKPMVDSGTLGTKGNTQVVVPFLTESYGSTQDPPEESIPICTLKNFPNKIEHTIQWARDAFEGWFAQGPDEVNNYLSNSNYLQELAQQPNTQLSNLETVQQYLVNEKPILFSDCVKWARLQFQREFHDKILQLLSVFPKDSTDSSGQPFWSGLKRAPEPITWNPKDPLHLGFLIAAANLRAFNYGLKGEKDPNYFLKIVDAVKVPAFKPDKTVKIAKDDAEAKAMAEQEQAATDGHEEKIKEVISKLPKPHSLAGYRLSAVEFEKDDDSNFHLAFITACSNLRARSYQIKEVTQHQTKFIAGKIIPAIATTTAMVTGLVCLEIFKLLQNKPLESYQNCYVNLAIPLFSSSEPVAPATTTTPMKDRGDWKWSLWDRIDLDLGDCTLQELLDHFLQEYGLEVNMLSFGSSMLYYNFGGTVKKKVQDRLGKSISKNIKKVAKVTLSEKDKYVVLEACVNDPESMEDLEIPYIRLKLRE